jgi:hypothetical protein
MSRCLRPRKIHQETVEYKFDQKCNFEGCSKPSHKGGVCVTHGAKLKRKLCSFEQCTNIGVRSGVCVTHGATVNTDLELWWRCNILGCTNGVRKGGICYRHGSKRKQCSHDGAIRRPLKMVLILFESIIYMTKNIYYYRISTTMVRG